MVYFAIDTETTGLPTSRAQPTLKNVSQYDTCRMLSLAIVEFSDDHKELASNHFLVKPDGFEVSATHIHGITQEYADENGIPFEEVYNMFTTMIHYSIDDCRIVGHNLKFDLNVLKSEFIRHNKDIGIFENITPICTLALYKGIYLKPIKLVLLYKEIFNKELGGAHDALNDARAAGEVYPYLIKDRRQYKPIEKKRIVIKASEVAACIGVNTYRPMSDVISDIWKKNNPKNFKGLTKEEQNIEAINSSTNTQNIFKNAMNETPNNSNEVQELVSKTISIVSNDETITPTHKKMINEHMRKMIYTTHGTRAEDTTADLDECTLFTDEKFYSTKVIDIEGTTYEIVGRIDRYQVNEDGTKTLVEIKNRTKTLFKKVRDYEMIQVQTYLHMMGLEKARLIEQYNNERLSYLIDVDHDKWDNQITPKLINFCKTLHHYMST